MVEGFFDLFRILGVHDLVAGLRFFERKYPNADRFVVVRSLAWFDDAKDEPDPIAPAGPGWDTVKARLRAEVARLE